MRTILNFLCVFLASVVLVSCSMEKRHYSKGYFVQWKKTNNKVHCEENSPAKKHSKETAEQDTEIGVSTLVAGTGDLPLFIDEEKPLIKSVTKEESPARPSGGKPIYVAAVDSFDVITMKSGVEIKCKVLEVNQQNIKYIDYSNPGGPTYTISKSSVASIRYSNGTKEIINPLDSKSPSNRTNAGSSGKSQIIALILCIFVGVIGVHRFYLGYIGIGILQIITFGGCGIWTLIDMVLIIMGKLKPKYGDYDEKLNL